MEEAIVDVALDLNLPPARSAPPGEAAQEIRTDHRDQAQLLATVPQVESASPQTWQPEPDSGELPDRFEESAGLRLQNRAARVEMLRQRVVSGTYQVDSAELARCIARNATRFMETC